ncbi:hypothetical protein F8388_010077 [Cannabis sativa]|uniref:Uncharacterized protein n=1 Tax=Cannabis sativa TaxID=3483 RepID=A0A7J6FYX4_CANSA|nr:hypothetical protein G4B88_029308 [Cannabis sativa]KAF4385521.1 hypothetical protein F8388_010077 [Cannabis sativa]
MDDSIRSWILMGIILSHMTICCHQQLDYVGIRLKRGNATPPKKMKIETYGNLESRAHILKV